MALVLRFKVTEAADEMAKEAAIGGVLLNIEIPFPDIVPYSKKICEKKIKGIFYFSNFARKTTKPWFFGLPRRVVASINRIRSGHTSLNSDLFKYKIVNTDLCKCEKEKETVEHIFFVCELYELEKTKMIKKLNKAHIVGPYSILALLEEMKPNILEIISKFIMNIGINI